MKAKNCKSTQIGINYVSLCRTIILPPLPPSLHSNGEVKYKERWIKTPRFNNLCNQKSRVKTDILIKLPNQKVIRRNSFIW